MENFISKIKETDKAIELAYKNKEEAINCFLDEIKTICNVFDEIVSNDEQLFKKELEDIAKNYNYKFMYGYSYGYDDKFRFDNIVRDFIQKFPYNIEGQNIFDELPSANYDWSFYDTSNEKEISIEVTPMDIYSRYPTDPENNNMIFYFILNRDIFNKVKGEKDESKVKDILMPYFKEKRKEYLEMIEEKIKVKAEIINKKLEGIDFSDPEVLRELKNRIK